MSKCKLCGDTHHDRFIQKHELCRVCYEAIRKFMMDDIGYYDADRIPDYYSARKKQIRRNTEPRNCVVCGKLFLPKAVNQQTCSAYCAGQVSNEYYKKHKGAQR